MGKFEKASASIDGDWILKNETKEFNEGPFLGKTLNVVKEEIVELRNKSTELLKEASYYLENDPDDIIFPEDSYVVTELDKYSQVYNTCCKFDLSDPDNYSIAYMGFDLIVKNVPQILEVAKKEFYGDDNDLKM